MLTITDEARTALRSIPLRPDLPRTAGLRIARSDARPEVFRVAPVPRPRSVDRIVEDRGARLFLGPAAVQRFRGATLDARKDHRGRIEFVIRRR